MSNSTINTGAMGRAIAKEFGLSVAKGIDIAEFVATTTQQALLTGTTVKFNGLGVLEPIVRAARKGFDPSRGAQMDIGPRVQVLFRPAKAMREALITAAN